MYVKITTGDTRSLFFREHYFWGRKLKKPGQIQSDDAIFLDISIYAASFAAS